MGFKELLSSYKNDQQIKKLGYERSRESERLEMREKIWNQNIIPGFKILDHFNTRTLLEEIKKDIWKNGEVVSSPNKIEEVMWERVLTDDGVGIHTSNDSATYELRGDRGNYIRIASDGFSIIFQSDKLCFNRIKFREKGRIVEKAGEEIKEKLFQDCIARENK